MLELALVGGGRMGETHLRAWRLVPELRVRALVEADPARLQELADRYRIPERYLRLEDALPNVQAVAVCLPPALTAEAAGRVLAAGRHLFVEKPVALDLPTMQALLAQARVRPDLTAQVGFHLRQHPFFAAARARALGELRALRSVFTNTSGLRPQPDWRASAQTGGSVLTNLGVHHFDLWRFVTGLEVEEVQAFGEPLTTVSVQARLTGGVVASAVFSHVVADRNALELFGSRERVSAEDYRFDGFDVQPVGRLPAVPWRRLVRLLGALPSRLRHGSPRDQAYRRQATCILRGTGAAGLEEAARALEIAMAAQESLDTGRPVRL